MYTSVILVFAFVCGALSAPPTTCPGGSKEGDTVDRGRFWYVCSGGQLVMKGCLSETKSRINDHATIKKDGFLLECTSGSNGEFTFKYKGCLSEKQTEVMPNDSWQDDNYWYTCSADGDRLKSEVKGCVDSGKRYNVGESTNKGDLIYECSHNANGNTGWDIYPNHAPSVTYNPDANHVQVQQTVPNYVNSN